MTKEAHQSAPGDFSCRSPYLNNYFLNFWYWIILLYFTTDHMIMLVEDVFNPDLASEVIHLHFAHVSDRNFIHV